MARIVSEICYNAVMERIEELLPLVDENTSSSDRNYVELDLLSSLASEYEEENYPIAVPSLTDLLKLRMYEMDFSQKSMALFLGISTARLNEILNGRREPSYRTARAICQKLDISPAIVLGV